jgi:hypothetical protein
MGGETKTCLTIDDFSRDSEIYPNARTLVIKFQSEFPPESHVRFLAKEFILISSRKKWETNDKFQNLYGINRSKDYNILSTFMFLIRKRDYLRDPSKFHIGMNYSHNDLSRPPIIADHFKESNDDLVLAINIDEFPDIKVS